MADKPKCSTCKWWRSRGSRWEDDGRGNCHGAPPHIGRFDRDYHEPAGYRIWPVTNGSEFCAAHASADAEKDKE